MVFAIAVKESYFDELKRQLESFPWGSSEDEFFPSEKFNVSAASFGSGGVLRKGISDFAPKTLEDLFSLTHQSLNGLIGQLIKNSIAAQIVAPTEFQMVNQIVGRSATLTGISIDEEGISYSLHRTLREHSMLLSLHFDKKDSSTKLEIKFAGNNERHRWDDISDYAKMWGATFEYPVDDISVSDKGIAFTLGSVQNTLSHLESLLDVLARLSFAQTRPSIHVFINHLNEIDNKAERNAAIHRMTAFIETLSTHPTLSSRKLALIFTEQLVSRKIGLETAERIMLRTSADADPTNRALALFICFPLLDARHSYPAVENAAEIAMLDDDVYVRLAGRELFGRLLREQRGFEAAERAVALGLKSENPDIVSDAKDLSEALEKAREELKDDSAR